MLEKADSSSLASNISSDVAISSSEVHSAVVK